ncbi:MAG: hypothetical protein ACO3IB_12375, partial [Phycisphaerales bacterium]
MIVKSAPAIGAINAAASAAPIEHARFASERAQRPSRATGALAIFEVAAYPRRRKFFMASFDFERSLERAAPPQAAARRMHANQPFTEHSVNP